MQLNTKINKVRRSDDFEESSFRIQAGAKAFDILSNNLYSNKIRAIIRELSCNAYDAHVDAGKEDTPFVIHLPTSLDRNFRIRDFGTGISPEDIKEVYTVYFASTKTSSNKFVGALGLGSKTPFSYADSFSVTSFYKGTKYIYSAFKNEHGEPAIAKLGEEKTDEPNGMEIQLAVNEKDFSSFVREAENVFRWFKSLPVFEGVSLHVRNIPKKDVSGTGWYISSTHSGPTAVMGNVAYHINGESLKDKVNDELIRLLTILKPVLEFPIGAVIPKSDRENLSYENRTILSIEKRMKDLQDCFDEKLEESISKCTTRWDAALKYAELKNSGPLRAYVLNRDPLLWKGLPLNTEFLMKDLIGISRNVDKFYYKTSWRRNGNFQTSHDILTDSYSWRKPFLISNDVIYVFNPEGDDTRKYSVGIFRSWMRKFYDTYKGKNFRVVSLPQSDIDKVIENLGLTEDVNFFYWKNMPKPPRKPRNYTGGGRGRKKTEAKTLTSNHLYTAEVEQWGDYQDIDLENGSGFYIIRKQNSAYESVNATSAYNTSNLMKLITSWNSHVASIGEDDLKMTVHSITPSQHKKLGMNWISVLEWANGLGAFLFSKEMLRSAYLQDNLSTKEAVKNKILTKLFEEFDDGDKEKILDIKEWSDYVSYANPKSSNDSSIQLIDNWLRFHKDYLYQVRRNLHQVSASSCTLQNVLTKSLEEKFVNEIKLSEKSVENLWNKYKEALDMFSEINNWDLNYGQKKIEDLSYWSFVSHYVRLREGLF